MNTHREFGDKASHILDRQYIDVSGQLHASAALPLEEEPLIFWVLPVCFFRPPHSISSPLESLVTDSLETLITVALCHILG
jgi:hypothetical protein